jgi:Zn-dependent protease
MDGLLANPAAFLQSLVLKVPALLVAVTIHEVAHGWVAERLGDPTARLAGRLTLNPLPHIDPLGALAFVLAGFGWARPVPVNARNLRHPLRDMALVGLAGPLSNFLVAFVALLCLELVARGGAALPFVAVPVFGVLRWAYLFNLALGVFNLIPIPPLDGGHFLPYLLPRGSWSALRQLEQYGPILLLILVISGITRYIIGPAMAALDALYHGVLGVLI